MVKEKGPSKGKVIDYGKEEIETDVIMVKPKNEIKRKDRRLNENYPRGIRKLASYSGVVRRMKCDGKCGGFDEILNLYVYKNGIVDDYSDTILNQFTGPDKEVKKQNVRDHGEMDKSIWGSVERKENWKPEVKEQSRKRNLSRPRKRMLKKRH